jgi:hypothetical protein
LIDNITSGQHEFYRVLGRRNYEDDYFYRLADEKGILVWPDFIFGCTPYPSACLSAKCARKVIYNGNDCAIMPPMPFGAAPTIEDDCAMGVGKEILRKHWSCEKRLR